MTALPSQEYNPIFKNIKTENSFIFTLILFNSIIPFYFIYDEINVALVSTWDLFQNLTDPKLLNGSIFN